MTSCNNIQIIFAPLPEEERDVDRSSAKEFALRVADRFRDEPRVIGGDACSNVEIHHLADWKKDEFLLTDECGDKDVVGAKKTIVVFVISCGPDGSVHRCVRKTTKWIKEQEQNRKLKDKEKTQGENVCSDGTLSAMTTAMVALLGHAVCKTSAEQMEDEVYSSGRRLAKSLQRITAAPQPSNLSSTSTEPSFLLETQVELEPPEEKLDGWVASWINSL